MVWSSPRIWTVGELVTAANMNQFLSDNLSYIKGVLDGTDLQNVAVHANKLLSQGGMRVHRHPYANNRHVESGKVAINLADGLGDWSTNVAFTDAFAAVPTVAIVYELTSANVPSRIWVTGVGTAGFTLHVMTFGSGAAVGNVHWIAEGQD